MAENDFDLVVIGAGPAGEKGAAQAAYFGKRVAILERESEPGGAAVHTGTLPSKTLRESALYLSGYRARELYGVAVELDPEATVQRLMSRQQAIAAAEAATIRANLETHRITSFTGEARIAGPHTVAIGGRDLRAEVILIATGSQPRRPAGIDFTDPAIHDSDSVLKLVQLPVSLTILGAGVIGCEYACMFAALGVPVDLVDPRPDILSFLDHEFVHRLSAAMERLGVRLILGRGWKDVRRGGGAIETTLDDGPVLRAEHLLFAAGRVGNTAGLGLEALGIGPDSRGNIAVDSDYRTAVPSIFAAGDVIGFPALASVSMEQGRVAVCKAFGFSYKQSVHSMMPYGIYTIPEVSAVGETEESCQARGIDYVIGRAAFADNPRGKISGDLEGMTKLIADAESGRLLGVHVIGERACELVHIGQAVIHMGGTIDVFIEMVFNYPSLADSYKYAAYGCLQAMAARKPATPA